MRRPTSDNLLAPPPLLLGVVGAFVACCLAGRTVSQRNPYIDFHRFHWFLNAESLFYPTASQVRALGRDLLDRDRIAVIVGGSSILHGAGQRPEELWTRHLQAELGDDYRVLNLALPGCRPAEFGGTAAEILTRDFPRLIFVSDTFLGYAYAPNPLSPSVRPAGVPLHAHYGYFFWDAASKGLLPTDAARETAIAHWIRACGKEAHFAEQLREMRVDALTYSRDLWTTLGYTTFWTGCTPPNALASRTLPRRVFPDLDGRAANLPCAVRYTPARVAEMLAALRAEVALGQWLLQHIAGDHRSGPSVLDRAHGLVFPPALRGRTLLLPARYSPYYVNRLPPRERADYGAALAALVRELERAGFAALEIEAGYSDDDFIDHCHLNEAGGRKLAAEVAPAVRRLAHRLGYDEGERGVSTPWSPPARQDTGGLTPPARHSGRDHADRE